MENDNIVIVNSEIIYLGVRFHEQKKKSVIEIVKKTQFTLYYKIWTFTFLSDQDH